MPSPRLVSCVLFAVLAVGGATPATPQDRGPGDPYDVLDDTGAPDPRQPWEGWYGPLADGLIGLRFGMDRFVVLRTMADREDLESSAARDGQLRFEGRFLGQAAEVLLDFTEPTPGDHTGRLHRIQVQWRLFGLPSRPLRLYEQLDGLLAARYGDPVSEHDDGFAALDSGDGLVRRVYVGPEARAQVQIEAYRSQRYWVILALESPQLTPSTP
ncbi:MAG TPA: hypothetical protein VKA86_05625 [Candidatus Krumholzibacteria bacterium]|nr:hypothetical protein [Candidatus Krumholzibacteria bacterium]